MTDKQKAVRAAIDHIKGAWVDGEILSVDERGCWPPSNDDWLSVFLSDLWDEWNLVECSACNGVWPSGASTSADCQEVPPCDTCHGTGKVTKEMAAALETLQYCGRHLALRPSSSTRNAAVDWIKERYAPTPQEHPTAEEESS